MADMTDARTTQRTDNGVADVVRTFDTRFLVALLHGEIDIVKLSREELVSCGLNGNGRHVGFATVGETRALLLRTADTARAGDNVDAAYAPARKPCRGVLHVGD